MRLTVRVWRQATPTGAGRFETHSVEGLEPSMSVLELLDKMNHDIALEGGQPVVFESDCREGICGACGIVVNGRPHGPIKRTPACHQRLSSFADGSTVTIEPFRSGAYAVISDLMVERAGLTEIMQAGGHVQVAAGTAPEADQDRITYSEAEEALDFAACIGCGACVAACPNGSANLFLGAKLAHLAKLPIPAAERGSRAAAMVEEADRIFGPCSLHGECAEVCPAGIPLVAVSWVNRERLRRGILGRDS